MTDANVSLQGKRSAFKHRPPASLKQGFATFVAFGPLFGSAVLSGGLLLLFPPFAMIAYPLGVVPALLTFVAVELTKRWGSWRYLAGVGVGGLAAAFATPDLFTPYGPPRDLREFLWFGIIGAFTGFYCTFLAPRWRDGGWLTVLVGVLLCGLGYAASRTL